MLPNCVFRNSKSWDIYIYIYLYAHCHGCCSFIIQISSKYDGVTPLPSTENVEANRKLRGIMYIELPLIIVLQRQREMRRRWRRLPARTFRRNYFDEGRRFLNLN